MYNQKNGLMDIDRQMDRRTDGQMDRQTDRRTDGQTDRQTDRQTDGQTDRQTDRQTDGQMDGEGIPLQSRGLFSDALPLSPSSWTAAIETLWWVCPG